MLIATESEEKNPEYFLVFCPNFLGHKACSGSFPFYGVICGDALDSQNIVEFMKPKNQNNG